jgi:hypothetical protein
VRNPGLIAVSKTATSDFTSREMGLARPIPDRVLFTAVLREDEYTRPRRLLDVTEGHFGVEHNIDGWEGLRDLYGSGELQVTFYRPWPFQRAYRLEFHRDRFPDRQALEGLLAVFKRETSYRGILEPKNQFLADRMCKELPALAQMYNLVGMTHFPHLAGPYRTGGSS